MYENSRDEYIIMVLGEAKNTIMGSGRRQVLSVTAKRINSIGCQIRLSAPGAGSAVRVQLLLVQVAYSTVERGQRHRVFLKIKNPNPKIKKNQRFRQTWAWLAAVKESITDPSQAA